MNTIFGYWRCSTDAQDQERQIRSLKDAGVEVLRGDKITGTSDYSDRKELSMLLEEIEEGEQEEGEGSEERKRAAICEPRGRRFGALGR